MDNTSKYIAIIGAGCSGLTAIKTCLDEGLIPVCFEQSSDIGGLWNYSEESHPERASVYSSCVINTSKEMMSFSDFPVPPEFPPFMPHSDVLRYFRLYAERFKLLCHIRFNHSVCKVVKHETYAKTGKWTIYTKKTNGVEFTTEVFDGVMVCSGHHCHPSTPMIHGIETFQGSKLHSSQYKTNNQLVNKTVLVVGIGNSGTDIAVDASHVTNKVHISTRRGAWVVARMGPAGIPMDALANSRAVFKLPFTWLQGLVELYANLRFNHNNFGLKPLHRVLEAHPTINDDLPHRILTGSIKIRPDIRHFTSTGVVFEDGSCMDVDVVVMATGYNYKFKFLDKSLLEVDNNSVNLYKYIFSPRLEHPTLAIIGLVQAIGAVMPISEMQSRWATKVFKGEVKLPPEEEMIQDIESKKTLMKQQYVTSRRHTLQTFWIPYMDEIAEKIGAKPNLLQLFFMDPWLSMRCFFGACVPAQYRLHDAATREAARTMIYNTYSNMTAGTRGCRAVQKKVHPDTQNMSLQHCVWLCLLFAFVYLLFTLF